MTQPDVAGAKIYVETAERPITPGRWHVLPDGTTVFYEPDPVGNPGVYRPSLIDAETLTGSRTTWTRLKA